MNKKGISEIISQVLIIFVVTIVVGAIVAIVIPFVKESQDRLNYQNSLKQIEIIETKINELLESPIGTSREININLSKLYLNIDENSVEIVTITNSNTRFFEDGLRVEEGNSYRYRKGQKIVVGITFPNLSFSNNFKIENRERTSFVIKKTSKDRVFVSNEVVETSEWFRSSSSIYTTNQREFEYRKLLLLNSENVDEDLYDFPVLINIEDSDLLLAKKDGSDIIFVDEDNKKLHREIEKFETSYRKKITIDHTQVEEDLEDFPMLVSLEDEDLFKHSKEDGSDIYFSLEDGTRLEREIEDFENIYSYKKKIVVPHTKVEEDLEDFPLLVHLEDEDLLKSVREDGSDIYFTLEDGTRLEREIESFDYSKYYRKKITIPHTKVEEDLEDFPLLVSLDSSHDDFFEFTKEDGSDIYFTLENGTRLSREIDYFDKESRSFFAWVKIPLLSSSTDTSIYIYFGDYDEENEDDEDVWDDDFVTVQHLGKNTLDSTKNKNNGTIIGSLLPTLDRFNKNNAYSFNSGSLEINNPLDQNNLEQIWTIDAWFNLKEKDKRQSLININYGCHFSWSSTKNPLLYLNKEANDYYIYGNGSHIELNKWQKITFRFRNSDSYRTIYLNGENISTSGPNKTNTPIGQSTIFKVGDTFSGDLDHIKISKIIRSDAWIKTEYKNQNDPNNFYSVENIETIDNKNKKELIAWIKIPLLSSTKDTEIHFNFGDPKENNQNSTNVWDANFLGVWHKNDLTPATITESTYNNSIGTKRSANSPMETFGKIGKAQKYAGVNDRITTSNIVPNLPSGNEDRTISFWIKPNDLNYNLLATIVGYGASPYANLFMCSIRSETGRLYLWGNTIKYNSEYNAKIKNWQHVVVTYNSNNFIQIFKNGEGDSGNYINLDTVTSGNSSKVRFGYGGGYSYFNGIIDEVRISNTIRSNAWIKAKYKNQNDPNSFYDIKDLELIPINKRLNAWIKIPSLSSTEDTKIYLNFGDQTENNENSTDVWDENYEVVMHFNENVLKNDIPNVLNSSKDKYHGTLKNFDFNDSSGMNQPGKISKSILLDGYDDYISIPQPIYEEAITYSQWINKNFTNQRRATNAGVSNGFIIIYSGKDYGIYLGGGTPTPGYHLTNNNLLENNIWYLMTWSYDKKHLKLYLNGELNRTVEVNRDRVMKNSHIYLGLHYGCAPPQCIENFLGYMDELRVSNIVRSPSWIKTEYNNQVDPNNFYNVGDIETKTSLIAWVKVPNVYSNKATPLYIYFGNKNSNEINSKATWDNNFVTVLHFNNNIRDSTRYNTITSWNGSKKYTTSLNYGIGTSLNLRHNNYVIINNMPHNYFTNTDEFTMSIIYKQFTTPEPPHNVIRVFAKNSNMGIDHHFATDALRGGVRDSGSQRMITKTGFPISPTYHITYTYNPNQNIMKLFVNGKEEATRTTNDVGNISNTINFTIGASSLGGSPRNIDGYIDEARISNIARSNAWVKAEYHNQIDPKSFISKGDLETL